MRKLISIFCILLFVGLGLWYVGEQPTPHIIEETDYRPSDWAWTQRTYPHGTADRFALREATAQAKAMRQIAEKKPTFGMWMASGPTNVGGRIVDVEFDPNNANVVYAAAATGGVFKSTDAGVSWAPIFDEQPILTIGDIGVDPVNTNILYVGTGEANGGHNNFAGGGVYKSVDGGATWALSGLEDVVSIGRILVRPDDPNRVFVAAVGSYFETHPERGVYASADGGQTWNKSLFVSDSTGAIDLVMDPNNPDLMYAAMWERVRRPTGAHLNGPTGGIFKTTNGGTSWTRLGAAEGLPTGTNVGRIGLAMSPQNPNVVYALYNNGSQVIGIYKTTNGGTSWTNIDPVGEISAGTGGFSWYFGQVRVHPTNANVVYILDVGFMRNLNDGNGWTIRFPQNDDIHVDHHALTFSPSDPDYLILGHDGGMSISSDAGTTWQRVFNLPITQFYEIGLDRNNPAARYGGTQDNGTIRTVTGQLDDWGRIWGGDGFYVIVDPDDPDVIYAESQFGNLVKSINGGDSFSQARIGINAAEPTNWATPVVMDPNDSKVLYYGTDRLYRSTNRAGFWAAISPQLTKGFNPSPRLGTVTTIAVAPSNSSVIYVGTDDGNVWVTSDGGSVWVPITSGLPERWVTRIAVDPLDENIAYATFSGLRWREPEAHVYRTTDKGQTWDDIVTGLPEAPVNAFAIDGTNTDVLYVGSDVGAFVSLDAGESWAALGSELPAVSVYDLKVHPEQRFLVAGTHGRSMYTLVLPDVVSTEETPRAVGITVEAPYPNPFQTTAYVPYHMDEAGSVRAVVYDVLGRPVRTLIQTRKAPGDHLIQWDGRNAAGQSLANGTYFLRFQVDGGTRFAGTRTLILAR